MFLFNRHKYVKVLYYTLTVLINLKGYKMYLKARFSKRAEAPSHLLISNVLKMNETESERIVQFSEKISKDDLKEEVIKHFKTHQGSVEYSGDIKYYEFYKNNKLSYKFNAKGEIIQNDYFLDLIIRFYFGDKSKEEKEKVLDELSRLEKYEDNFIKIYKIFGRHKCVKLLYYTLTVLINLKGYKMCLQARFSKRAEAPCHPLISHALKMSRTESERIVRFSGKASKDNLKEEVIKHFKNHQGEIRFFGEIEYYEFYKNDKLSYKFNTKGEIIQNDYFLNLIIKFYFDDKSKKSQDTILDTLHCLREYEDDFIKLHEVVQNSVNKTTLCELSDCLSKECYAPDYRDIALELVKRKNLNKKKIYLVVKKVFDGYFERNEKDDNYWLVADEINEFLKKKEIQYNNKAKK